MSMLFVFVPAIEGRTGHWDTLRAKLAAEPECAGDTFLTWPAEAHDRIGYWTHQSLESYSIALADQIDHWFTAAAQKGQPYDNVVLVGNSIGALVVRWAWLYGSGAFGSQFTQPWAAKVSRLVLAAGISRGYVALRKGIRRTPLHYIIQIGAGLFSKLGFSWVDALAGSGFVTNLRLIWMRHLAAMGTAGQPAPSVVQILGDADSLVEREDSRDIEQFPTAAHVAVPDAKHGNVLDISGASGAARYNRLRDDAFLGPLKITTPPPPAEGQPEDVVHFWYTPGSPKRRPGEGTVLPPREERARTR